MPNINQIKESRFLKKEDCANGILMTFRNVEQVNSAKEGAPEELKWCAIFDESDKPMVLNSTNNQIIAQVCRSENTDDWTGHKIVLFHDPNVSYAGKLIGGIRCRAPRNQPAKVPAPQPGPGGSVKLPALEDDSIPF